MPTLPLLVLTLLSTQVQALPRVRSEDPSIAVVIASATDRSATFKQLMVMIQATDGVVYVEEGRCGFGVLSCLWLSVTVSGPFRVLRVRVDRRRRGADCDLMASIGHELKHAIEVLSEPHVTDVPSMYSFLERQGRNGLDRFETQAAFRVGLQVGKESCRR